MSVQEEGGGVRWWWWWWWGKGGDIGVNKKKADASFKTSFFSLGVIHGSVFCLLPRLRPLRPLPRELRLFQMFKYNKHGPDFYYKYRAVFFIANP